MHTSTTVAPNAARDPDAVWLVTGCSSGFGKALAIELARAGRKLVATARHPRTIDYLPASADALVLPLDVTQPETIAAAIEETVGRFGRLDVVINNAGIGVIGPVEDVTDEQTRLQFEVNVFGVIAVVRAVAPVFRRQRRGFFINFSSMAGQHSVPSLGVYSASKFAVEGLSEALRQELGPYGVRVMLVEPGSFDTEWLGKNAVWAPKDAERYPGVWEYVTAMKAVYADRKIVGDPRRAAEAILRTAAEEDPPFRLPLHEASADSTRKKLAEVAADLDRTREVTAAVHF